MTPFIPKPWNGVVCTSKIGLNNNAFTWVSFLESDKILRINLIPFVCYKIKNFQIYELQDKCTWQMLLSPGIPTRT